MPSKKDPRLERATTRDCPVCGNVIQYADDKGCRRANKKGTPCVDCKLRKGGRRQWSTVDGVPTTWFNLVRRNAKNRELDWSLSIEFIADLYEIQEGRCALSGIPIQWIGVGRNGHTVSIDRIDSSLGYTENNVQLVHPKLNRMKMDLQQDDFLALVKAVAEWNGI